MKNTERFSARATDYAAARPSYPDEAIDALFSGLGDERALHIVDLGAGTGISSRLLAARGGFVYAVEPNAAMRQSAEPRANVEWVTATAENSSLPSGAADLVTAFQAFHWFVRDEALLEIRRILRPKGRAAILYNERDESDRFTGDYGEIVRTYATDKTEELRAEARAAFASFSGWSGTGTSEFANAQQLDREGLHARTRSASYLPNEGTEARELHDAIDGVFDRHAVDGVVTMCMKTIVTIGDL